MRAEAEQARKRLIESETRFRNMIEQAPIAITLTRGPDVVIESINAPMLQLMNKPATEDVIGKKMTDVLPELEDQLAYKRVQKVQQTGQPYRGDQQPVDLMINGHLEQRYFNFSYTAIVEPEETTAVLHVAIDVTENVKVQKKIEEVVALRTKELSEANEALLQSNRELQRSNQNLEEFAHAASHDLKEPVRKIIFFTEQLKLQLPAQLSEANNRSFDRIENATKRMGALIDDLLIYSHVTQIPHEQERINLNEKIERALAELELDIEERGAVIQVAELPSIKGCGRQLQQLFQNLISNALKYSKAGVAPKINITALSDEVDGQRYDVVTVQDNGIGFDQQYADKIFEMFVLLHTKSQYGGTGIGLSIVKKVAENHGGFVRAEGSPGDGSTFFLYLPVLSLIGFTHKTCKR